MSNKSVNQMTDDMMETLLRLYPNPVERNHVLTELGEKGEDKRPGIGCIDGVPDIAWCEVPAGSFIFADSEKHLDQFYISKYLTTVQQFQAFIDDDGYNPDKPWWKALMRYDTPSSHWSSPTRPVDSVNWHDAMAFCWWLSLKTGDIICLPTPEQWEKAARGPDGFLYPWGNSYIPGYANCDETDYNDEEGDSTERYYLQETSVVGMYPQGASPYGALDMAGNLWEWSCTEEQQAAYIEELQAHFDTFAKKKSGK